MCKISVITPVYKVENYLRKCIDSILNQSFDDFELIIVDDGSPDNCGAIADDYKDKDSRVKVIHKENGGAPSARNEGIKIAKGKYLYFPDSDDWIEENYLEELYKLAVSNDANLVISGYTMEYYENNKKSSYKVSVENKVYLSREDVVNNLHLYFDNMMMAVPWNKLYKTSYIKSNELFFPNLKWDDLHFNMEVILNINKVVISSNSGYHFFRSREGSETTTVFDGLLYQKRREQFEHILKVYRIWNVENDNIMGSIYGYYASRLVQCIQEISISNVSDKRSLIRNIIYDQFNNYAIEKGKINSKLLRLAMYPMKYKNITLCLLVGKIIGFIKNHMSNFFYKIKSITVNKAIAERS